MHKKKILRLTHKFLISEDGYDLDIQDLCRFTSKKFENHVLTYINVPLEDYAKRNNLLRLGEVYYHKKLKTFIYPVEYSVKYDDYLKDLYRLQNIKKFIVAFRRIYKKIEPDIIHIHGTVLPQFLYTAIYARKRSKIIVTHHIGKINQAYTKQKPHILLLKYIIHNLFPLFSNKLICVSNYGKTSFDFFKSNIEVINPIPKIQRFKRRSIKDLLKNNVLNHQFRLTKHDVIFCCIGRITKQKNQLNIVRAFNKVVDTNPNYKLILVGEIKDVAYYKLCKKEMEKHPQNFCLITSLNNENILNMIKSSDYMIAASFNEGFGRVAIEAMLLGRLVIASKNSGYEDFIKSGKNGILVNPDNLREIETAIRAITKMKFEKPISSRFGTFLYKNYVKQVMALYGVR